jgi:hypothetical protein
MNGIDKKKNMMLVTFTPSTTNTSGYTSLPNGYPMPSYPIPNHHAPPAPQ